MFPSYVSIFIVCLHLKTNTRKFIEKYDSYWRLEVHSKVPISKLTMKCDNQVNS